MQSDGIKLSPEYLNQVTEVDSENHRKLFNSILQSQHAL